LTALDAVLRRYLELYSRIPQHLLGFTSAALKPCLTIRPKPSRQRFSPWSVTGSVEIDLTIDASLIGGFVINIGSQVIDASLSGQVRRLGLSLAKAS
jgi:F0F1-type ATP synthase, delta subunit (mitochondrial oligomycin sensitivity protein)